MVSRTYQVEEGRLPWLAERIARLAKRAAKLGCEAPSYTLGEPYEGKEGVRYIPVTLSGEAPKYAGWTFAATLERIEEGEVLVRSITEEPLPAKYRSGETSGECDHCKTWRNRTETFVVKHESGEYRQVGRQCIRDFLGHTDPDRLAAIANLLSEVLGLGEGEGYDGGGERVLSLGYYLSYVAAAMNAYGWCSRTKAREEEGRSPTANIALDHADPSKELRRLEKEGQWTRLNVTPADTERAQVALEWASELSDEEVLNSDYLHNLRALTRAGSVTYRTAGYAASIIIACEKAQDRVRAAKARPESNYVGEVGKREVFKAVTVNKVLELDSDWGVTYLHLITDAAGNDLKWFGSKRLAKEGETVDVKATVKKHEEYKGRKQTLISRAVINVEKVKKVKVVKVIAT